MRRYIEEFINTDLKKKMVFLGGPRQVGKTHIAKSLILHHFKNGEYLNWDKASHRKIILESHFSQDSPLIVFDELHKYPKWKSLVKGIFDTRPKNQQYMVTGSARLDVYKKGGDSMLGRYHYWRLHPLTLDELPKGITPVEGYKRLMTLGGFPEPFLGNDLRESRRWRRERFIRVIKEDIRDLENTRNLQLLELFVDALRERAGSTLVISNLAADLQVSPKTAKEWLNIVERMYLAFPIYPLTKNIPRSIQKPAKVFFYDNADIQHDEGARLENLVATHLLKRLNFIEDYEGRDTSLHYIRDKDGREVDFVTVVDGQVADLIEVKLSDENISTSLKYYSKVLKPQRTTQIVGKLKRPYDKAGIRLTNPIEFFKAPPWEISK